MNLIFDAVDKNAREYPESIAFQYRESSLSNSELALQSNRLAHALLALGVINGSRVGIFCKQSLKVPIALFGIQKAGAAYVPIDPKIPAKRLRQIIQDLGISVLITDDEKSEELSRLCNQTHEDESLPLTTLIGVNTASIDGIDTLTWQEVNTHSCAVPDVKIEKHDLAYIITTSGSTGTPKGIMHSHHSGLSYARLSAVTYAVCRDDCLGNFVPLHFDISTFAYFTGPLTGARVVIIPEEYLLFPANLVDLVETQAISIWYSVPYPLLQIAQNKLFQGREFKSLRWVKFGGESMHPKYLRLLMQQLPQARFSNVYGPAEVNQCTYHHFSSPPHSDDPLPIGQIWDETDALILNAEGEATTSDEEGELLIHSPTMMQGYWNRPDLNGKAFYYQKVADDQQKKYFRTGDLVMTNRDGQLVFRGRKDRQVKVRGYRVELDEIESVLVSHEMVNEAVAMVTKYPDGGTRIIALVTLKLENGISEKELISYSRECLPGYAVPASISILETFPRTSTGKIHRNVLAQQLEQN